MDSASPTVARIAGQPSDVFGTVFCGMWTPAGTFDVRPKTGFPRFFDDPGENRRHHRPSATGEGHV